MDLEALGVNEAARRYVDIISAFATKRSASTLSLDGVSAPTPSSSVRAQLHPIAEQFNLDHESLGSGEGRFLTLSQRIPIPVANGSFVIHEYLFCDVYIGLRGPHVNRVAKHYGEHLHESVRRRREERDGADAHHHITVANAKALQGIPPELTVEQVFDRLKGVPDDWKPVGLGSVRNESGHHAFFVVLSWPSMTQTLAELGIPDQHFHITLGFQADDIHNLPKDETSLVTDFSKIKLIEAIPKASSPSSKSSKAPKGKKVAAPKPSPTKKSTTSSPSSDTESDSNSDSDSEETPSSSSPSSSSSNPTWPKPKLPPSAYKIFFAAEKPALKAEQPNLSLGDLAKTLGERWKNMSEQEKKRWVDEAAVKKQKYLDEMKSLGFPTQ